MNIKPLILDRDKYIKYFSNPLWYTQFTPEMEYYFKGEDPKDPDQLKEFDRNKKRLREYIIELYNDNLISFGKTGTDLDRKRKKVDKIVIHHTAGSTESTWEYINIQHLFSLYIPEYLNQQQTYYKTPIWSNHIKNGKMIFCAYHYLIWEDGSYKQMLEDNQIGWHSGNWDINTSSISICFVGTYTDSDPSKESINTAKNIISKYPKDIKILGHREVYENTICPGNIFLGKKGWKKSL